MRICFLNKSLDIKGGMGRFGRNIVESISKRKGIEAIVLTEKKSGHKLEKPILKKAYLLRDFLNIFTNALKIRKYVKDYDIIHALDGYPYGVIAVLANIGLNKKLFISALGTFSVLPLEKPIKRLLLKWAYKKANKILCISSFTEKQILKRMKLANTTTINLGVDYEKFVEKRGYQREISREKVVLSVAGGLKRRKGLHIAISAINIVKEKYSDIKYYIVGSQSDDAGYFTDLKNLVKNYNLEKNVIFLENLSDEQLIKLYYSADVFLLVSINIGNNFEGFGLVYLEAGACGRPVIGTYNCGAEDAVVNSETGFLVPQNDIKKTAEAVLRLLDDPNFAKKLGENGKKRAQQMSWDNIAKKYIKVYEDNFN